MFPSEADAPAVDTSGWAAGVGERTMGLVRVAADRVHGDEPPFALYLDRVANHPQFDPWQIRAVPLKDMSRDLSRPHHCQVCAVPVFEASDRCIGACGSPVGDTSQADIRLVGVVARGAVAARKIRRLCLPCRVRRLGLSARSADIPREHEKRREMTGQNDENVSRVSPGQSMF